MKKQSKRIGAILLAICMLASLCCVNVSAQTADKLAYWVDDGLIRTTDTAPQPAGAQKEITIYAAKNEFERQQIVVNSADMDFRITGVDFTDLKGKSAEIGKANLSYNFALYELKQETITGFGSPTIGSFPASILQTYPYTGVPDPLSNDAAIDVKAGLNQPIYVTVAVPEDAAADTYSGSVTVHTTIGELEVPIHVQVFDVTIPESEDSVFTCLHWDFNLGQGVTRPWNVIKNYYGAEPYSPEFYEILDNFTLMEGGHRQNAKILSAVFALDDGNSTIDENGVITFDWTYFDAMVDHYLGSGKVNRLVGMHLGYGNGQATKNSCFRLKRDKDGNAAAVFEPYLTLPENEYKDVDNWYGQYLPALTEHLLQYDISGYPQFAGTGKTRLFDIWIQHLCDEPSNQVYYNALMDLVNQYMVEKDADGKVIGKIKTLDAENNKTLISSETVRQKADIWVPLPNVYENNKQLYKDYQQNHGDELWNYVCIGPGLPWINRFMREPDTAYPLMYWYDAKEGITGYLHYALNGWSLGWYGEGDSYITYPDPDHKTMMSSIRYDGQRDGLEDYELLVIAKTSFPEKTQALMEKAVTHPKGQFLKTAPAYRELRYALLKLASGDGNVAFDDVADAQPDPNQADVIIRPSAHGVVRISSSRLTKGDSLTITAIPDEGYYCSSITSNGVPVVVSGGKAVLENVQESMTVRGVFDQVPTENLAFGKNVTLNNPGESGCVANDATDGIKTSGNLKNNAAKFPLSETPFALTIDMEGAKKVGSVVVSMQNSLKHSFSVYSRETVDGEWVLVGKSDSVWFGENTELAAAVNTVNFEKRVKAAQLKVVVDTAGNEAAPDLVNIYEIEANASAVGTNVALTKPVSTSSPAKENAALTDGNIFNDLMSDGVNHPVFDEIFEATVDLCGRYSIRSAKAYENVSAGMFQDYMIYVKDGEDSPWVLATGSNPMDAGSNSVNSTWITNIGNATFAMEHNFKTPVKATHIKITSHEGSGAQKISFRELEAIGVLVTQDTVMQELENAVAAAEKTDGSAYTAVSYQNLMDAVSKAKAVLEDPKADIDDYEEQLRLLKEAEDQLLPLSAEITMTSQDITAEGLVGQAEIEITVTGAERLVLEQGAERTELQLSDGKAQAAGLEDGKTYVLIAAGNDGRYLDLAFTVDLQAPVITGVTDGETIPEESVVLEVKDAHLQTVTLNGEAVAIRDHAAVITVTENGSYTVEAKDAAGHCTKISFVLQKDEPDTTEPETTEPETTEPETTEPEPTKPENPSTGDNSMMELATAGVMISLICAAALLYLLQKKHMIK